MNNGSSCLMSQSSELLFHDWALSGPGQPANRASNWVYMETAPLPSPPRLLTKAGIHLEEKQLINLLTFLKEKIWKKAEAEELQPGSCGFDSPEVKMLAFKNTR